MFDWSSDKLAQVLLWSASDFSACARGRQVSQWASLNPTGLAGVATAGRNVGVVRSQPTSNGEGEEKTLYTALWWMLFALLLVATFILRLLRDLPGPLRRWAALVSLVPSVVTLICLYPFWEMSDPWAPLLQDVDGTRSLIKYVMTGFAVVGPLFSIGFSAWHKLEALPTRFCDWIAFWFSTLPGRLRPNDLDAQSLAELEFRNRSYRLWESALPMTIGRAGAAADDAHGRTLRIRGHHVEPVHATIDRVSPPTNSDLVIIPHRRNGAYAKVEILDVGEVNADGHVLQGGETIRLGRALLLFKVTPQDDHEAPDQPGEGRVATG